MKKVIVLGAGRGQIPVINLCHKYGWYVISVSPKGNYPGLELVDEVFYEDVKNYEAILKYAEHQGIDAILTDQLDAGVLSAAYISEKLGLKSITYDVAMKFTNKFVMRNEAAKAGVAVPKSTIVSNADEIAEKIQTMNFPLMMKPVDSAASRGVYKVNSLEEIQEKLSESLSYSKTKDVIIEEFIEGKEFVVEAFTKDYKVTNLVVGHRDYFDVEDTFIPNATVFIDADSADSHIENMLKSTNKSLVESFGLPFGITHGEYIYNEKEDKIYLVEIAARGGGVFISSDLIPAACGVNANDLLVREVLGIASDADICLSEGASAYFCYLTPAGVITEIKNTEVVSNLPGVLKAFFDNVNVGMNCLSIKDKSSRKGPILVSGKTKKECYNIIDAVKEKLIIKISDSAGEKDIIWN